MFIDNFTTQMLGMVVDIDGVFMYQCVDLVQLYVRDGFGLPVVPRGNAIDWWTATKPDLLPKFDRIPTQTPQKGDIVVLHGLGSNVYGHIVLCVERISDTTFLALEQNGSTGNGRGQNGDVIRTRQIPTSRIAGVLRPKSSVNPSYPQYYTIKKGDTFWALERAWGMPAGQLQILNPALDPRKLQIGHKIRKL